MYYDKHLYLYGGLIKTDPSLWEIWWILKQPDEEPFVAL